jgi:hypothetical protein
MRFKLLLSLTMVAAGSSHGQALHSLGCLTPDQQSRIVTFAQRLLRDQDIDGEIRRWQTKSQERKAMRSEASECGQRLGSIFESIAANMDGCRGTVARYNNLIDEENDLYNSVQFKQQFVRNQLEIERSTYPACR